MEHRVRAAGLLINGENTLLVLHRHPENGSEWWIPPGGGLIEEDDSIFQTAQREIFEETGLTAALSRICYIREFRETSTNIYHLEFFMPVDAYTGEITLDNIPKGDLDDGIIKAVKWLHRTELGDLVVYPEWMVEEWFWQDANAGFPQTKYTDVGVEETISGVELPISRPRK